MPPKTELPGSPIDRNDKFIVDGLMLLELFGKCCCGEPMVRNTSSNARLCQHKLGGRTTGSQGFATEFSVHCRSNPAAHKWRLFSSVRAEGPSGAFAINVQIVLGSMLKGEKYNDLIDTFAMYGVGSLSYTAYADIRSVVQGVVVKLSQESRDRWIQFIKLHHGSEIDGELDGTWSKRYGHNALFGAVFALHALTNKIIGVATFSRYCHKCNWHIKNGGPVPEHECEKNWDGSAGAMEKEGFREIACGLLEKHDVRLARILADGDSKGFNAVVDAVGHAYSPRKLNDKTHYAKRYLNALKSLSAKLGDKVLTDGKKLGGSSGRMTETVMKDIRVQIGSNLVHHVTSRSTGEDVSRWILCALYHRGSTDEVPHHEFCSPVFCRYLQAKAAGKEKDFLHDPKKQLDLACIEQAVPKFIELMSDEVLDSLRHEFSTNHAESANSVLWSIDGKDKMSSAKNAAFAAGLTTCFINDGYESTITAIYDAMGIHKPEEMLKRFRAKDDARRNQREKRQARAAMKSQKGMDASDLKFEKRQEILRKLKSEASQVSSRKPDRGEKRERRGESRTPPAKRIRRTKEKDYGSGLCGTKV